MSNPSQIAAVDGGAGGNGFPMGPYDGGANGIFAVLFNAAIPDIEIWKSLDGGQTWAQQNSANNPAPIVSICGSCFDSVNGIIYVAYVGSDTNLNFKPFNVSTSTWGAQVNGGPGPLNTGFAVNIRVCLRSTGPLVFLCGLEGPGPSNISQCVEYKAGAWGAAIQVASNAGTNKDYPVDICPGSAGLVHVFTNDSAFTTGALRHVSLNTVNALSVFTVIANNIQDSSDGPTASINVQSFYDSVGGTLYVPGYDSNTSVMHIFSAPESAVPNPWTDNNMDSAYQNPLSGRVLAMSALVVGVLQSYRTFESGGSQVGPWSIVGNGSGNAGGYISPGTLFSISLGIVTGKPAIVFTEDPSGPASFAATRTMFFIGSGGGGGGGTFILNAILPAQACGSVLLPFMVDCCNVCDMQEPMILGKAIIYARNEFTD